MVRKSRILGKNWFRSGILVAFSLIFSLVSPSSVFAKISSSRLYEFGQINALFYEPGDEDCITVRSIQGGGQSDGSDVYALGDASVYDGTLVSKITQKMSRTTISSVNDLAANWQGSLNVNEASSRGILVMGFGASSSTFDMQAFMNTLSGSSVKVIFVTAYGADTLNSLLSSTAQNNANISLMDFAAAVGANTSKYLNGGVLTADGAELYASTLQGMVNGMTSMNRTSEVTGEVRLAQYQLDFVDKYQAIAASLSLQYGIPWETVMAQGILESTAGTSTFAVERNNFFGIAAYDSDTDKARRYATPEEGWIGYYENIRLTSVYRANGVFQGATVTDPYEYAVAIKQAGYATSETYVQNLVPIIDSIIVYSKQKGWASSAQIAAANPVWYENAAKNAEGNGSASGNINYNGYFCYETNGSGGSTTPSSGGSSPVGPISTVPGTITGESERPITGVKLRDSSSIACDSRTTDIGVYEGSYMDKSFQVRLCKLDQPGYQIKGNDGGLKNGSTVSSDYVPVNSLVSGAFAGLAHKYYEETGSVLQGTSGYRTRAYQEYLYETNPGAAAPGKSKHEAGLAIDITTGCKLGIKPGECGTTMDKWLTRVVGGYGTTPGGFGLTRPVYNEAWHVQMSVNEIVY